MVWKTLSVYNNILCQSESKNRITGHFMFQSICIGTDAAVGYRFLEDALLKLIERLGACSDIRKFVDISTVLYLSIGSVQCKLRFPLNGIVHKRSESYPCYLCIRTFSSMFYNHNFFFGAIEYLQIFLRNLNI